LQAAEATRALNAAPRPLATAVVLAAFTFLAMFLNLLIG
jgi:hypothetical protein